MAWLITAIILVVAGVLLVGYIRRLQHKSRAVERSIDYSKLKEWRDED